MKFFLSLFCLLCLFCGVFRYWNPALTSQGKNALSEKNTGDKVRSASETAPMPTADANRDEKGCGCCKSAREKVRQKRKALELWAREMIDTHGYAEGMKRVTEKSATLAKRIQGYRKGER